MRRLLACLVTALVVPAAAGATMMPPFRGLPKSVASVIERHHAEDTDGEAAIVRLADMLAHYGLGGSVSPAELLSVAKALDIRPAALRTGAVAAIAAL